MTAKRWDLGGLLAAAVLLAVVVVAWRFTVSVQRASTQAAAWESVAATAQADIAVGHVWLEERLAGDRSVDVRRDVRKPFAAAVRGCDALRHGGGTLDGHRVTAVQDKQVRRDVVEACRRIDVVRAMTDRRLAARAGAGSLADQRYDAAFRAAFALAQGLPARLRELGGDEEARLRRIEVWAIVALAAALLLALRFIRRGERRLERLVREREAVLEVAGEGILALDPNGTVGFANTAAAIILGWPVEDLTGRLVAALLPEGARRDGELPEWLTPAAGRRTAELRRRDGTTFPIEYTATSVEKRASHGTVVVTFRDITARRRRDRERDTELLELRAIRATLVPAEVPDRPDLEVSKCFVAAESGVAGDFYLVTAGPDETTVLAVGDVAGKGVAAAQRAAFVRTTLATFAPYTDSPARLLELANSALVERAAGSHMLVTAVCAVVCPVTHAVTWAIAGHPAPLWLDDGSPLVVRRGLPLGLEREIDAQDAAAPLPPGAGFVLFTDGLSEARAPAGVAGPGGVVRFGVTRISELVAGLPGAAPAEVVRALREAAERFSNGALSDDLCILAVRATATREPAARTSSPSLG